MKLRSNRRATTSRAVVRKAAARNAAAPKATAPRAAAQGRRTGVAAMLGLAPQVVSKLGGAVPAPFGGSAFATQRTAAEGFVAPARRGTDGHEVPTIIGAIDGEALKVVEVADIGRALAATIKKVLDRVPSLPLSPGGEDMGRKPSRPTDSKEVAQDCSATDARR